MRRRSIVLVSTTLIINLALLAAATTAQTRRDRLTVDVFLDWEMVASPQVSPDGRQVVYTRRWTDKVNDKYEDEIWIVDADGGGTVS